MRRFLATAVLALLPATLLPAADPAVLQNSPAVYFWPMSSSFDQYLAQETAAAGVFQVVVDPKLARAFMTDRIDSPFLAAMDELFPKPEEAAKAPAPEASEAAADGGTGIHVDARPKNRPLGRPHGTLFLVDVHTREVLWSTYLDEADRNPNKLHKQARNVVERLRKHLNPGL